jgi:hypothetical protein
MRLSKILILILIFASSCVELFVPETSEYEDVLFIEALVTNDSLVPPHVLISKTLPITIRNSEHINRTLSKISGASVTILCDDGNSYDFIETDYGIYAPADPLFTGENDKSYKLAVSYNGQTFESDYELLRISPPIDSLTSDLVQAQETDIDDNVYGLRFFASTHDDNSEESYYRWLLNATYSYSVPHNSTHKWLEGEIVNFDNYDLIKCYKDKNISGLYVSTTEGLAENKVIEAPLNFESQYGDELSQIYSLHAKQLRISEPAYKFWFELNKLIYETGGLYETQPFRLSGNIECVTDQKLSVIGIFEVAGVSEAREYFFRPPEINIYTVPCQLWMVGTEALPWDRLWEGAFLILQGPPDYYVTSYDNRCFDCTLRGGTTEVPPFWEY